MHKLLWLILLGLISIGVIYVGVNTKSIEQVVARDSIDALVANDDRKAFELMSPTLQSSYGATSSITASVTSMVLFRGSTFVINIPSNWLVTEQDGYDAVFIGPKIGEAHAGVLVRTQLVENGQDYKQLALEDKKKDSLRSNYTELREDDLSGEGFGSLMTYFHWFNESMNMVIFERKLYVQTDNVVFLVRSSQPNNPKRTEFDTLFRAMFESFKVGRIEP